MFFGLLSLYLQKPRFAGSHWPVTWNNTRRRYTKSRETAGTFSKDLWQHSSFALDLESNCWNIICLSGFSKHWFICGWETNNKVRDGSSQTTHVQAGEKCRSKMIFLFFWPSCESTRIKKKTLKAPRPHHKAWRSPTLVPIKWSFCSQTKPFCHKCQTSNDNAPIGGVVPTQWAWWLSVNMGNWIQAGPFRDE